MCSKHLPALATTLATLALASCSREAPDLDLVRCPQIPSVAYFGSEDFQYADTQIASMRKRLAQRVACLEGIEKDLEDSTEIDQPELVDALRRKMVASDIATARTAQSLLEAYVPAYEEKSHDRPLLPTDE